MCTFEVPLQRYIPEIHGGGLCCFTLSPRIKSAGAMRALLHASEAPSQAIHAFSVTTITKFRFLLRPVGSIAYSHSSSLSSLRNSLKHGRRLNSSAAGLYKLFIDPPSYQKADDPLSFTRINPQHPALLMSHPALETHPLSFVCQTAVVVRYSVRALTQICLVCSSTRRGYYTQPWPVNDLHEALHSLLSSWNSAADPFSPGYREMPA